MDTDTKPSGDGAGGDDLTAFERFVQHFQNGLNGVLYILCKEVDTNPVLVVLGMTIDFLQLVSFPLYDKVNFPWNDGVVGWFSSITNAARIYGFFDQDISIYRILFYIGIGVVTMALGTAIVVGVEFSSGRFKYFFLLKVLRSLSGLFIGFLYIPIVAVFTLNINCTSAPENKSTMLECGTTGHIVGAVFAGVVQLLYCSLSFILAGNYYARLPTGAAILSRPNARGVVMQLAFKTIITMLFLYLRRVPGIQWLLIAVVLAGSGAISFHYSWYMPYYRFSYNMLHAGFMWLVTWTTFSLALVNLVNRPTARPRSGD